MGEEIQRQLRLLLKETWRRRIRIGLAFASIALAVTAAGAVWPKTYSSSTTVLVEETNIIDPLMAGRAVRADMRDHYENAQEVIYSRSLLRGVLESGGWLSPDSGPAEVSQQLDAIKQRVIVSNPGENLVEIQYRDSDPDRAFETVREIAQRFIDDMRASKSQESTAAFNFIDRQVKEYEAELEATQQKIRALREANPLAQPGSDREVAQRMNTLRGEIDDIEQRIREARIRETTLTEQLSGEAEVAELSTVLDARRQRIADLQRELDTLRLSYHETYPDIVRIKEQLADLRKAVAANPSGGGGTALGEKTRENPVFQKLQAELYTVRGELRLLDMRRAGLDAKLAETIDRASEVQNMQAEYEKLDRDYQVNRDIYQDLLRRRENARVSVSLDSDQQALTLRVNEPAYRPHDPSGPRMLHFAIGGVVLGAGLPVGLLFGVLLVDPRVRSSARLIEGNGIQVLETIPHMDTASERRRHRLGTLFAGFLVVAGMAGVVLALIGRQIGVL